jgi:hypothetical protein
MKKVLKRSLLVLLIVLVVIQFFRPGPNRAAGPPTQDITAGYAVPQPVMHVLQRSCYDCHSNNTSYPWYSKVQPVAWWLDDHIKEGKRELNFSEFAAYSPKKAAHKLDEIIAETGEREMPLSSYTLMHSQAKLSDAEIKLISDWATALGDSIRKANNLPMSP